MSCSSSARRALARAAAFLAGQQAGGVAGVEQDHAALRQVGLDPLDGAGGEIRVVGRDRPVEQREQGQVVGGDVDRPAARAASIEVRIASTRVRPVRPASLSLVDVRRRPVTT